MRKCLLRFETLKYQILLPDKTICDFLPVLNAILVSASYKGVVELIGFVNNNNNNNKKWN